MLISLIFAIANAYFAFTAFQRKQWVWLAISSALCVICAADVARAIL